MWVLRFKICFVFLFVIFFVDFVFTVGCYILELCRCFCGFLGVKDILLAFMRFSHWNSAPFSSSVRRVWVFNRSVRKFAYSREVDA